MALNKKLNRRNFLKADPVEMRHIMDEFQRVAMANCDAARDSQTVD